MGDSATAVPNEHAVADKGGDGHRLMGSVTGFGWWQSLSSNVTAMLLLCLLLGLVAAIEAKFKCVGREKIQRFEHQNAKLRDKMTELLDVFGPNTKNGQGPDGGVGACDATAPGVAAAEKGRGRSRGSLTLASPVSQQLLKNALQRLHVPDAQRRLVVAFCEQLGSGSADARRAIGEALLASGTFPVDVAHNFLEHMDAQETDQRLMASEPRRSVQRSSGRQNQTNPMTASAPRALTVNPLHEQCSMSSVNSDRSTNCSGNAVTITI